MILKDGHSSSYSFPIQIGKKSLLILLGICLLLILISYIPRSSYEAQVKERIFCGAEELVFDGSNRMFQGEGALFENAESQSDTYARTGNHSSKTDKDQAYGMFYLMKKARPGDRYRVSIWRYGNKLEASRLVVSIDNPAGEAFYKHSDKASEIDDKEWEKLELSFEVPAYYQEQGIRIYPMGGASAVYFDDLSIERVAMASSAISGHIDSSIFSLNLKIDDSRMDFLKNRRQEILNTGIYFAEDKDWVKARIIETADEIPVKLRFKGDWMDHLKYEKWSFRIRAKEEHAWNRMTTFSIQRPENRDFLSEWMYHQFLAREDVLSPRYDFVKVSLNGEKKGIYALEEHFEKILPEYRARREGPILKFSEDGVWNARKRSLDMDIPGREVEDKHKSFEAAEVLAFREKRILEDSVLRKQFEVGRSLMLSYKEGKKAVSEIFDLDLLAKYYAITDICQAHHSTIWHNQRFYYNPVLAKLEPIAYDGYTESGIFGLGGGKRILGEGINLALGNPEDELIQQHMRDTAFVKKYHQYLNKFTQPAYLDDLILDLRPLWEGKLYQLRKEYFDYTYEPDQLKAHARRIRALLFPLNDNSIRVSMEKGNGNQAVYRLRNYHLLPLEIIALDETHLEEPIYVWPSDQEQLIEFTEFEGPKDTRKLLFKLPGLDEIYESRVLPWSRELAEIPLASANFKLEESDFLKIEGKKVLISGKHLIDKDILIPPGYRVEILPGTRLDFVKGAAFISRSAVQLLGTEEEAIHLYSSDKTASGFTVLQAAEKSSIRYTNLEHFSSLNKAQWQLTGALCFYESEVDIAHLLVHENQCEDAINLIRSEFEIRNSVISHSFSDGLDVDFGKGDIHDLLCIATGNDGVDFSGSRVNLFGLEVRNPGDKGISVGEESFVIVYDAKIEGANIALASKDLSNAEVKRIEISSCNTAFTAYQKKPEFGPAKIKVEELILDKVNFLHLIERGSELRLKGKLAETL